MLVEHRALENYWHVVAEVADVGSEPLAVRLLARDLVLWRGPSGGLVAAPDRCPHREAPLSSGVVHDGCLSCPYHGWTFGAEGRCASPSGMGSYGCAPASRCSPSRPSPPMTTRRTGGSTRASMSGACRQGG